MISLGKRRCQRGGFFRRCQEFPPAMFAAKVITLALALAAQRFVLVDGHAADWILCHSLAPSIFYASFS
jgi:hypothetical protein